MKKIISLLFIIMLTFSLMACTTTVQTYNNKDDFSNQQGYNNWYYYEGSITSPELMIFSTYEYRWVGNESYNYISKDLQHPGASSNAMFGWKAPQDGQIDIDFTYLRTAASELETCNGIVVGVYKNSGTESIKDPILRQTIGYGDFDEYSLKETMEVSEGDIIFFTVNSNGDVTNDNTNMTIDIDFTPSTYLTSTIIVVCSIVVALTLATFAVFIVLKKKKKE